MADLEETKPNSKKSKTIHKLVEYDRVIVGSENNENTLNNYFKSISLKLRKDNFVVNNSHMNYMMERSVDTFNFKQVTSVKF